MRDKGILMRDKGILMRDKGILMQGKLGKGVRNIDAR